MTFSTISVLVPTRGRVARLATMRASFYATAHEGAELIFRVDEDDRETQSYLIECRERMVVGPRFQGYRSMGTFFNELALETNGDVLMCGNDDMVFMTDSWPQILLREANRFPDGVFNLGVATHNEDHFPFSVTSRAVMDRLGFLWDPRIFWGDIYLRDLMEAFGRCRRVPAVEILHEWQGHTPDPEFGVPDDIYERDPGYWIDTHAPIVAEAIEKLRGMVIA